LKKPSLNLNWEDESKILPSVNFVGSTIKIKNLRDWRYKTDEVISKKYYDDSFELEKLSKVYLLFNPFGQWDGVGHSFLLFEFEDNKTFSVSIEARKEQGEKYDFIKGILNEYEVWYAVGSSADFFTNRAIFHQEDLYIYPLLISKVAGQSLLLDIADEISSLEKNPKFYNTISSNCTNLLADSANRVKDNSVPWHYARIFTGFIDNQLYDLGYIPHDKPFEQIYQEARIDQIIREKFEKDQEYSDQEFWQEIKKIKKL